MPAGFTDMLVPLDALEEELELAQDAFFTDPEDQSAYIYHRWLIKSLMQHADRDPQCHSKVICCSNKSSWHLPDKLPAHHLVAKGVLICDKICSFQSSQWQRACIWCTCGCNFTERKCVVLPSVCQSWTLLLLLMIASHSGFVSAGDGHSGSWREKLPRVAWTGGRQIKV